MKNIDISFLAEKLNSKVWEKNGIKRIYCDYGYNTKKTNTKTYVYQKKSGEYAVSCNITCYSQDPGWIASQEKIVKQEPAGFMVSNGVFVS